MVADRDRCRCLLAGDLSPATSKTETSFNKLPNTITKRFHCLWQRRCLVRTPATHNGVAVELVAVCLGVVAQADGGGIVGSRQRWLDNRTLATSPAHRSGTVNGNYCAFRTSHAEIALVLIVAACRGGAG